MAGMMVTIAGWRKIPGEQAGEKRVLTEAEGGSESEWEPMKLGVKAGFIGLTPVLCPIWFTLPPLVGPMQLSPEITILLLGLLAVLLLLSLEIRIALG
jgi:hypothetical protein